MRRILPSTVQGWVTYAVEGGGLSPRSVRKYDTLLHGIFAAPSGSPALLSNPAARTELPKVIIRLTSPLGDFGRQGMPNRQVSVTVSFLTTVERAEARRALLHRGREA